MNEEISAYILLAVLILGIIAIVIFRQKGQVRSPLCVVIGLILLFLQVLSWAGAAKSGMYPQISFSNPYVLIYDLGYLIGSNLVGIIGLIVLIIGARKKKLNNEATDNGVKNEQPKAEEIFSAPATTGVYKMKREEKRTVDEPESTPGKICFCRKCGEKLLENSRFCRKCGAEVIDSKDL